MSGYVSGRTSLTTVQSGDIASNAITEAKMADDAISLTELKAGVDGEIISWDASGNPVAIGAGSSGEFLKSQGAGSQPVFAAASGGKVLQVLSFELTTTATTSSTSFVDTGLTLNITPAATSSKILVFGTLSHQHGTSGYPHYQLMRGGSKIAPNPASPSNHTPSFKTIQLGDSGTVNSQSFTFLDSPSSTSALTYAIYYRTSNTSYTNYINRSINDTDNSDVPRCTSVITLMEIGA